MNFVTRKRAACTALALIGGLATSAFASGSDTTAYMSFRKESSMNHHASGPFDVKLNLLEPYNKSDAGFGRRSIDKQFHGDLDATSQGEMLSVGSAKDSGGY